MKTRTRYLFKPEFATAGRRNHCLFAGCCS